MKKIIIFLFLVFSLNSFSNNLNNNDINFLKGKYIELSKPNKFGQFKNGATGEPTVFSYYIIFKDFKQAVIFRNKAFKLSCDFFKQKGMIVSDNISTSSSIKIASVNNVYFNVSVGNVMGKPDEFYVFITLYDSWENYE